MLTKLQHEVAYTRNFGVTDLKENRGKNRPGSLLSPSDDHYRMFYLHLRPLYVRLSVGCQAPSQTGKPSPGK